MEEINERKEETGTGQQYAELFCGSDASAVRASMIYSFIATCKANDVEPREWFEDVIRRIPEYENGRSDVTHLLPKNWKRNSNDCNLR